MVKLRCVWNAFRPRNHMWHLVRHRQPAQIAIIAPFAIVALISIVGVVVDIGIFRLIDSELENAADAAALAAAWYDPVCPGADSVNPDDPVERDLRCPLPTPTDNAAARAQEFGHYNLGLASTLCGSMPVIDPPLVHPILSPNTRAVTVIVHCRAGYVVGRILGLGSTEITRWGTAAIGQEQDVVDTNGTIRRNLGAYVAYPVVTNTPAPPLLVRLVPQ
jgi:hypothetical protein